MGISLVQFVPVSSFALLHLAWEVYSCGEMARWRGAGGILQDSTVWGEIVARGLHVENSSWLFSLACHEVKHPSVSPLDTVHFTLLTAHCTLNTAH